MQNHASYEDLLDMDEEKLLLLSENGNDDAMTALIFRYLGLVRKKASRVKLSSMDVDDLTQEGIIGLMDAIRSYNKEKGSSFYTYANICVDNRLRKTIAHANAKKNVAFEQSVALEDVPEYTGPFNNSENPESIVIEKEKLQLLKTQINTLLSSFERETLSLYLKGCDYNQMAKKLDTSYKAVDNALQRVRRKLKIVFR
ncbi:MAG: polymerase sporulation specific sigma factor SigH [Oscillospiraceae bacterium]|jgi:RNA polymerase sporulation-specific sigma factor|nr:polymerase sporulation specific sigma factor SigH [Oscillospiraceae bacterium]